MNILRYCDFFNTNFHFYYENKDTISIFGGFMCLCYILSSILITIILSMDDFKKLNPLTTKSEVEGGEFRVVNLKESKIYIPWRLITYEEKFINHKGILYPMVTLIEGELDSNIGMNLKYHNLKYSLCNETSMVNITGFYHIDTPLNELYCIQQDDIPFGGSWLADKIFYLEVNLFLCEDGIKFNASDKRCTILEDIVKFTNTTWLFEFYYPVVQFQPTNQEIPMVVIYKNYYYRLSSHTYKLERLYVQENILSDSNGLFSSSSINTSFWGISTIYGDTYFWSEEQDPLVKSNSSVLFSLDIYMDQGHIYYSRSYRKIFETLSNVFPLLNILLIIFEKFTIWVKSSFARQSIVEIVFESSKNFKTKNRMLFNIDKTMPRNKPRNTIFINKRPKFDDDLRLSKERLRLNKLNNIHSMKENYSANKDQTNTIIRRPLNNYKDESYLELYNSINIKGMNKSREKTDNLVNRTNIEEQSNDNIKYNDNIKDYKEYKDFIIRKEKRKLFPLFYFFMDIFIQKLDRPKSFCCLDKKYLIVYNFMERILNISSYILLYRYISLYKSIFTKEIKNFNFYKVDKKININNNELMENIEQKIFTNDNEYNEIFSKTIINF